MTQLEQSKTISVVNVRCILGYDPYAIVWSGWPAVFQIYGESYVNENGKGNDVVIGDGLASTGI